MARPGGQKGMLPGPLGILPASGGGHRWFPAMVPSFRLAFKKGQLAAKTWWAQVGSNHRLLACKAEYGTEYAQLSVLVYVFDLRKPRLEMPLGAWKSLHGSSRKWFREQSVDPSLEKRVGAWRQGDRGRTRRMAGTPVIAADLTGNHYE